MAGQIMQSEADGVDNVATPKFFIAVTAHIPYRMPLNPIYMPLQLGQEVHPYLDFGFTTDDTGDNISAPNGWYSELTGLYWLGKNVNADYNGLVYCRRHFATANRVVRLFRRDCFDRVAKGYGICQLLSAYAVVVPRHKQYYIETIYSHDAHIFDAKQFAVTKQILIEAFSVYSTAFDTARAYCCAHMFVMRAKRFDAYCEVLSELGQRLPLSDYEAFTAATQAGWARYCSMCGSEPTSKIIRSCRW
ncbi:DUF4422 domain-containing protein [Bifidobacterium mongoliense]|uniref:DUF4422 domain-containing protein n=1 Tax=Bifidobacterium mongoliense TaxID=518643 RepID=UPI0030EB3D1E